MSLYLKNHRMAQRSVWKYVATSWFWLVVNFSRVRLGWTKCVLFDIRDTSVGPVVRISDQDAATWCKLVKYTDWTVPWSQKYVREAQFCYSKSTAKIFWCLSSTTDDFKIVAPTREEVTLPSFFTWVPYRAHFFTFAIPVVYRRRCPSLPQKGRTTNWIKRGSNFFTVSVPCWRGWCVEWSHKDCVDAVYPFFGNELNAHSCRTWLAQWRRSFPLYHSHSQHTSIHPLIDFLGKKCFARCYMSAIPTEI